MSTVDAQRFVAFKRMVRRCKSTKKELVLRSASIEDQDDFRKISEFLHQTKTTDPNTLPNAGNADKPEIGKNNFPYYNHLVKRMTKKMYASAGKRNVSTQAMERSFVANCCWDPSQQAATLASIKEESRAELITNTQVAMEASLADQSATAAPAVDPKAQPAKKDGCC
ncbi:unnamed protein product [Amoebophrya sp. A25]|nr:unnamed protein product [Amoebophrya sp. A25]|eukprot:GSA25T00021833001.1